MKKGQYFILRVILGICLALSGFSLGLDILRLPYAPGPDLLRDLVYFSVSFGLYQNRRWAFYPGIVLFGVGIITLLLVPDLSVIAKLIGIGFYMGLLWLLYSFRELFTK